MIGLRALPPTLTPRVRFSRNQRRGAASTPFPPEAVEFARILRLRAARLLEFVETRTAELPRPALDERGKLPGTAIVF
jgi:hypothetical protein